MNEIFIHKVIDTPTPIRIRSYLKTKLGFSTSLIAKVKYDNVYLNDRIVHMRAEVTNGDVIKILFPIEDSENITPMDLPLTILYEDDYIIALDKPINMPVHPCRGNSLPTLANALRSYFDRPFVFRAINRLDRDTSGIVLIAKNQLTAARLSESMKKGQFKKIYEARVIGCPEPSNGKICAPIRREAEGSIKRIVASNGKYSETIYEVKETNPDGTSICVVEPITGRTHQIRVHMAYIGHPLYADYIYGKRVENQTFSLRCISLSFPHPFEDKTIIIESKK